MRIAIRFRLELRFTLVVLGALALQLVELAASSAEDEGRLRRIAERSCCIAAS